MQVGGFYWADGDTATGGQGAPVDAIPCGAEITTFHIHSHLTIALNDVLLTVPGQIGITTATSTTPSCTYQIHTHDGSGRIHVEAPAQVSYNLGNFFHVWGQPLAADNIAGITTQPIVIYITEADGTTTVFSGDPNTIDLTSHRLITIQIGDPPLSEIPNFTWSQN